MRARPDHTRRSPTIRARHIPLAVGALLAGVAVAGTSPAAPDTMGTPGTWQLLPAAPVDLSAIATGVWTGREVLVTSPARDARTGAAYDPAAGSWRRLPVDTTLGVLPGVGDHAVWTGREMLVWGGFRQVGYKPATNRWRRLRGIPVGPEPRAVVAWTGTQMLGWGGGCCGDNIDDGAAYRPRTNSWRKLPAAPLAGRQSAMSAWTGRELVIIGGSADGGKFADGAAYDPTTRRWRRIPPLPAPRWDGTATWDGRDVIVVGGKTTTTTGLRPLATVFAYRPSTNRWRRLPPMPRGRAGHVAVWTGTRLLVWGGSTVRGTTTVTLRTGMSLDPIRHRWLPLPASPLALREIGVSALTAVWTGTQMIVLGGGANDAAAFTPAS